MDKEVKTHALKNINLSMSGNRMIGIMGPSGSGKSSLLYLISGLKKPTKGKIFYEDKEITSLFQEECANLRIKEFGFIFQRHFLIEYMTVMENILTPINSCSREDELRALELLKELNLEGQEKKKPSQLSGGQRQRVAIARALINNPKVIFADELTASLDHKTSREVMRVLSKFKKTSLIIVVTHDRTILDDADEIINIIDGEIYLDGEGGGR
ncbi:MAG: ABC transporter ATP-binding protein, partial [Clostridium sp.]